MLLYLRLLKESLVFDGNDLGKLGEDLAVAHLEENGYLILERNFVIQKAEIDIIANGSNIFFF